MDEAIDRQARVTNVKRLYGWHQELTVTRPCLKYLPVKVKINGQTSGYFNRGQLVALLACSSASDETPVYAWQFSRPPSLPKVDCAKSTGYESPGNMEKLESVLNLRKSESDTPYNVSAYSSRNHGGVGIWYSNPPISQAARENSKDLELIGALSERRCDYFFHLPDSIAELTDYRFGSPAEGLIPSVRLPPSLEEFIRRLGTSLIQQMSRSDRANLGSLEIVFKRESPGVTRRASVLSPSESIKFWLRAYRDSKSKEAYIYISSVLVRTALFQCMEENGGDVAIILAERYIEQFGSFRNVSIRTDADEFAEPTVSCLHEAFAFPLAHELGHLVLGGHLGFSGSERVADDYGVMLAKKLDIEINGPGVLGDLFVEVVKDSGLYFGKMRPQEIIELRERNERVTRMLGFQ